jgi:hypothetical protein
MPNWKRIIVGDAFKVSSGGVNQLRNLFLVWLFLLFSILAVSGLFGPHETDRSYSIKSGICAVVAVLLATERLMLIAGALAYVSIRLAIALIFVYDSKVLLALIVSGGILLAIVCFAVKSNWKPSYTTEKSMHLLDLVAGLSGLVLAIVVATWMKP